MNAQTTCDRKSTPDAGTTSAAPLTFRRRIERLQEHIFTKMDLGTTERHEMQYIKTGNLLAAAERLLDALHADFVAPVIQGSWAVFTLEAGLWDQTETLKRIAGEQGVACKIELSGARTSVDLTGAERGAVESFLKGVLDQAASELANIDTCESA